MTLLTVTDVATRLHVSRRTVYHRIRRGYFTVETITVRRGTNGGQQPAMRVHSDSPGFKIRAQTSTRWRTV